MLCVYIYIYKIKIFKPRELLKSKWKAVKKQATLDLLYEINSM